MAFNDQALKDYIDVAERIAEFHNLYPGGSLQPLDPAEPFKIREMTGTGKDGKQFTATFIIYTAAAYRSDGDPRPGIGVAWEVFPGRTSYTLGSELMNAETSAWGRALAALGVATRKGIASRQEVDQARERQNGAEKAEPAKRVRTAHSDPEHQRLQPRRTPDDRTADRGPAPPGEDLWAGQPAGEFKAPETSLPDRRAKPHTPAQMIAVHWRRLGITDDEERHNWTARMAGVDELASTTELPPDQQRAILTVLAQCKDIGKVQEWIDEQAGVPS